MAETKKSKRPLILLNEIQKATGLLDVAQDLSDRGIANFVFTGSLARKLYRSTKINLLPGRVVNLPVGPFHFERIPQK